MQTEKKITQEKKRKKYNFVTQEIIFNRFITLTSFARDLFHTFQKVERLHHWRSVFEKLPLQKWQTSVLRRHITFRHITQTFTHKILFERYFWISMPEQSRTHVFYLFSITFGGTYSRTYIQSLEMWMKTISRLFLCYFSRLCVCVCAFFCFFRRVEMWTSTENKTIKCQEKEPFINNLYVLKVLRALEKR